MSANSVPVINANRWLSAFTAGSQEVMVAVSRVKVTQV